MTPEDKKGVHDAEDISFGLLAVGGPRAAAASPAMLVPASPRGVSVTLDRFERAAGSAGVEARPTKFFKFSNSRLCSYFFTAAQLSAADLSMLPMRVAGWKAGTGRIWSAYRDPVAVARLSAGEDRDEVVAQEHQGLAKLVAAAVTGQ